VTAGQAYLARDLQVAAQDETIIVSAILGGNIIDKLDAGAVPYKRLNVSSYLEWKLM
jgi:hypothetical protein